MKRTHRLGNGRKRILIGLLILLCVMQTGCGKKAKVATEQQGEKKCTMLVECSTAINSPKLSPELQDFLPNDGIIFSEKEIGFEEGESVYDVLQRTMKEEGILMEASFTGDIAYIEGIDNLYEFACGDLSGWMYCVNGEYPNIGCSGYQVKEGDRIEWHYSCDMGSDLGQTYEGQEND